MCLGLNVFYRVFSNLIARLVNDLLDRLYRICCFSYCGFCSSSNKKEQWDEMDISNNADDIIKRSYPDETFYQVIDREMAEKLLINKQNGTFIIRPSTSSSSCKNSLGTLSIVQDCKIFHLNIRKRQSDGLIALGTEKRNEKCFGNLNNLINYYISNYLVLYSNGKESVTLLLPYRGN